MTQLALFEEPATAEIDDDIAAYLIALLPVIIALTPPAVDKYTLEVARGGLSHFRAILRGLPGDAATRNWVAYFERMRDRGYLAAQAIRPQTFVWMGWATPFVDAADEHHGMREAT